MFFINKTTGKLYVKEDTLDREVMPFFCSMVKFRVSVFAKLTVMKHDNTFPICFVMIDRLWTSTDWWSWALTWEDNQEG